MAAAGENSSTNNSYKIIIIGAGMAGLSAANHLAKHNCLDFKILEARTRIGGRIVAINTGSNHLELGANWIHGVLGNPMFELAMSHGLIDIVQTQPPHRVVAATEAGKQVPFPLLQEIYEAYLCFLRRCEEYFLSQYDPPDGIASVGEHIQLEIELYLEQFPSGDERKIRQLLFNCLLKRETCISGCDTMSDVDLLELGSYAELQGGNIILPGGYSSILEPVKSCIPDENILLEQEVKEIRWSKSIYDNNDNDSDDSDKTVTEDDKKSLKSSKLIEILCENNIKYYCNHLICTIPLGVLKSKSKTLFNPSLPPHKSEAIDKLLFGTVDKIFLEYERPFLNSDITEVLLLWNDEEEGSLEDTWFRKIYSFTKVTDTLLLGWVSGKEAEYMESLEHEAVGDKCTEILRLFLGDPFVPKPKRCVCTSWSSQPYTRGSYTAIAVGASQADIEAIARPLYSDLTPSVLFAGEHTHSSFYSTVHGAYLSGRTAAQKILEPPEQCQGMSPGEVLLDAEDTCDLSSWVRGISLD